MNKIKRGIYQHFKDKAMIYEVLGTAVHTEDETQKLVIYRALYKDFTLYARPESMFLEEVDKPEFNYKGPRFIFIKGIIMPHIHEKIDFVVETFIIHKDKVLLRLHDKFNMWLSIGGHIELDEDPNQAALREVKEEVGLDVKLYDEHQLFKGGDERDRQLIPPIGLSRHFVNQTHEHVCHVYFATSQSDQVVPEKPTDQWKWVSGEELDSMGLEPFVLFYAKEALKRLGK